MIKRILKRVFSMPSIQLPTIKMPTINLALPKITLPTPNFGGLAEKSLSLMSGVPFNKIGNVVKYIFVAAFLGAGIAGLTAAYVQTVQLVDLIFTIQALSTVVSIDSTFTTIEYLKANLLMTIAISSGLIATGMALNIRNANQLLAKIKATPMAIIKSPIAAYRKVTVWRNWLLAKINYLNEESAKWKTTFKIMMSPYSFLRAMGFSPQMAIGLLAVGGTAGTGVVVNETVLADRSFSNGDSGIYAAPALNPSPTLEQTMAWRKENKEDNTLRIVLSDTPVREIKIENVSVGTVYNGSAIPSSAHTSAGGTAAAATAVLIGGTVVAGENAVPTFLEVGELLIEKSRCTFMYFDNITAHTINVIGNASDGQSINTTPGTSRMRAVGGGHHQAEAMVTSGGSYDRIHIDAPTSNKNGKIDKLTLSNLYTEGGACVFDRMKIGTLTVKLNEIGGGGNNGVSDGFATKEFKIHQSVTAANWNVSDNVEVVTGAPTETLTNE